MYNLMLHVFLLFPMAEDDKGGPENFLSGPNWGDATWLNAPMKWVVGFILVLVIAYGIVHMALALLKLPGSDRHKAKQIGEAAGYALAAVVLAFLFQDFIGTFLGSFTGGNSA